jgi:DNA-directed RNA polymerase alpha subunit
MALVEASKILRKHLSPFVQYFELGTDVASEDAVNALRSANTATLDPDLQQKLGMTVQELDLSVRANNCLESAKITTVRDLVKKTDGELLKVRSFGKTSLREVKRRLADMGLSLGMDVDGTGQTDAATMPDDDEIDETQPEGSAETEAEAESSEGADTAENSAEETTSEAPADGATA